MNLRSKIVIITLMAVVALVGVGYASWTFTTAATGDVNVTSAAYAAIEANNVQVKNAAGTADVTNLYIICDQPSGHGIYWSTTNDSTAYANKITQVKLIGSVNEDDNDYLDFEKYTGTFSCSYAGISTLTYITVPAFALNQDVESANASADVEYVYTLPELTYKAAPTSVAQVNAMLEEVNALSIQITFNFSVKSVA